jgi:hypothetical protein
VAFKRAPIKARFKKLSTGHNAREKAKTELGMPNKSLKKPQLFCAIQGSI